ncbi:MAG: type II secretion system protein [Candidatus Vogelbacteria bacterium]|nr:type II secretion system protein [Candidatus Vogelbacteria bacterium]
MKRGFTLIEIMVAVSIFAIVAVITTGALVTASEVNRKAQAIKIAMDNVSFAMDSMVFNLREGASFGCLDEPIPDNPWGDFQSAESKLNEDCTGYPGIIFAVRRSASPANYIIYRFDENSDGLGSIQVASDNPAVCSPGACPFTALTSSEVDITDLRFSVPDTQTSEGVKPRVTIVARGEVPGKNPTEFNLQTTVKANF